MLLSIIIVNYNVSYFLEQCLYSVEKALRSAGLSEEPQAAAEILVFDNHSTDGSRDYLPPKFPRVRFFFNGENIGFGAANNRALAESAGEVVLFLNPDTILPEDLFKAALSFLRDHPRAGALGFRRVDGAGRYLKESRRGYPSPWVAFCKLGGLTALFPRSRPFAGYYLGHLPEDQSSPAPILSGACLFVTRQALERTGGFDERFFMYAEDIDLSHRIGQAGFVNYYIADPPILHFKGESTHKDARYIRQFYKAMSQFRRKHSGKGVRLAANRIMDAAIWARAGIAAAGQLFHRRTGAEGPMGPAWVTGDPKTASLLRTRLSGMGWALASSPGEASRIIYCEGDDYSFGQIIASLRDAAKAGKARKGRNAGDRIALIHAAGSSSLVGSPSKAGQGEAYRL
ncbi:MAG: glycosyltransferase family 2 protein [Bacteroidota bacterium]|nr:glycosyltransferase family 2 protein [Bacteroidota bacterium]